MFGIGNEQKAVEVSQAEIAEDIEVVRKLFLKHEKFLRVEESNEGGHFIRAPMLRNLQEEILDALPGRIVMKLGGNPPLVHSSSVTITFSDDLYRASLWLAFVNWSARLNIFEALFMQPRLLFSAMTIDP